jgi:hypothetical protein
MPVAIVTSVRERKCCALSSGRTPELIRTAPITKNAPIITKKGSKLLMFMRTIVIASSILGL